MAFMFSAKSIHNLAGVHPALYSVMQRAITMTPVDFMITEGLRTKERQAQLVKAGASKTMNSRHLTGHAVDIAPIVAGEVRWDWPLFDKLAEVVRDASNELNIPIRWGGNWKLLSTIEGPITGKVRSRTFADGPHFELPKDMYP